MRTIVHISDLHFGRTNRDLERALRNIIEKRRPDLVIVSGDLTQRATAAQFQEAEHYFASLHAPVFVVPGNHDVPVYSFWRRLYRPYARYRHHISDELEPEFIDNEMAVLGMNTVRIFKMVEGRVNRRQVERVHRIFSRLPKECIKIVVSHHPFNVPVTHHKRPMIRAKRFWETLGKSGVDMFLSGHLHDSLTRLNHLAYKIPMKGPLIIQAGTAISTRRRREGNTFNIMTLNHPTIEIERYTSEGEMRDFEIIDRERFRHIDGQWLRVHDENPDVELVENVRYAA